MKQEDQGKFAMLMSRLAIAYRTEASEENTFALRVQLYWEQLYDLTLDAIAYAINISINTIDFFPKVSEIRKLATQFLNNNSGPERLRLTEGPVCSKEEAKEWLKRIYEVIGKEKEEKELTPAEIEVRECRRKTLNEQAEQLRGKKTLDIH